MTTRIPEYAYFGDGTLDITALDIALDGAADVTTRLRLRVAEACSRGARLVLLDVSGLTTVTPSGVADLLHAMRAARTQGADLRAYGHSPVLTDALEALDLRKVFTVHANRQHAIDRTRPTGPVRHRARRPVLSGRRSRSAGSS
ncbi:STAS domain-containing protein [Gordonia sp. LSe1-13]|uniref:STAS domain-containing protein n=1 Tax=Gordonia sesuvii TaxID=3116777 RepID=A0ABU7ME94_9ACTN|nr:STAS domain-containing protein [Gordonia sp. LSe1-13]